MNTFNVAAAPVAPAYVADLWQIESNTGYLNFKFKNEESASQMLAEVKADPEVFQAHSFGKTISVHYKNRSSVQAIAKAISEAYNIEVIGVGFRLV